MDFLFLFFFTFKIKFHLLTLLNRDSVTPAEQMHISLLSDHRVQDSLSYYYFSYTVFPETVASSCHLFQDKTVHANFTNWQHFVHVHVIYMYPVLNQLYCRLHFYSSFLMAIYCVETPHYTNTKCNSKY